MKKVQVHSAVVESPFLSRCQTPVKRGVLFFIFLRDTGQLYALINCSWCKDPGAVKVLFVCSKNGLFLGRGKQAGIYLIIFKLVIPVTEITSKDGTCDSAHKLRLPLCSVIALHPGPA